MNATIYLYLVLAALAANLPFVSRKVLFFFKSGHADKLPIWWLIELLLLYFIFLALGLFLESRFAPVHTQNPLAFYGSTLALFFIAASPGFVFRCFWRQKGL